MKILPLPITHGNDRTNSRQIPSLFSTICGTATTRQTLPSATDVLDTWFVTVLL